MLLEDLYWTEGKIRTLGVAVNNGAYSFHTNKSSSFWPQLRTFHILCDIVSGAP